ncbi:MAG TPA: SMR domain protein, partial [Dyella sp.]
MKQRQPKAVSDDDARLFREAIGEVRQFDPVELPPAAPKPEPRAHMFEADEAAVPAELLEMAF